MLVEYSNVLFIFLASGGFFHALVSQGRGFFGIFPLVLPDKPFDGRLYRRIGQNKDFVRPGALVTFFVL